LHWSLGMRAPLGPDCKHVGMACRCRHWARGKLADRNKRPGGFLAQWCGVRRFQLAYWYHVACTLADRYASRPILPDGGRWVCNGRGGLEGWLGEHCSGRRRAGDARDSHPWRDSAARSPTFLQWVVSRLGDLCELPWRAPTPHWHCCWCLDVYASEPLRKCHTGGRKKAALAFPLRAMCAHVGVAILRRRALGSGSERSAHRQAVECNMAWPALTLSRDASGDHLRMISTLEVTAWCIGS